MSRYLLIAVLATACSTSPAADDALSDARSSVEVEVFVADSSFPDEAGDRPLDAGDIHLLDAGDARFDAEVEGPDLAPEVEEIDIDDVCDCEGPVVLVTMNSIPLDMNGSEPFLNNSGQLEDYYLAVPTSGFVWDVYVDCPCGCTDGGLAAWSSTEAGDLLPGDNLWPMFSMLEEGHFRWFIESSHSFAETESAVLGVSVEDTCGNSALPAELEVEVVELTEMLHPFDLEDPWLMTYHRDHQTVSWQFDDDGHAFVTATFDSNGIPDFFEDLWTAGLGTPQPLEQFATMECGGFVGGTECLARELLERTRRAAYQAYLRGPGGEPLPGSVNIHFLLEGEEGAPDPSEFEYQYLQGGEVEKSFSMIGFGGGDLSESLVGLSETLDDGNLQNENNAKALYGCLTTSLMRYFFEMIYSNDDFYALAAMSLGGITPALGGVPIGEQEGDHLVVDFTIPAEELPPEALARRKVLSLAMDILGTGLGALMAHEIGHSLGLVATGAPPHGLFGSQKKASFVVNEAGCKGAHLDTEGPNLMASGPGSGNMDSLDVSYLTEKAFFNELNLAYLQGRIVLLPPY